MTSRRQFISLLGGAAAWPGAALGQQAALPVIGFLHVGTRNALGHLVEAFRRGLAEAMNTRGVILDKQGHYGPAEAAFREALGILDQLAADHPQATEYRESLARTAGNLGDKRYVGACHSAQNCWMGAERSVELSLHAAF